MKLTFHGGVGEVTGANYLLESPSADSRRKGEARSFGAAGQATKILVDCGLHQGGRFSEARNWDPFPYDPKEIAAVFITHAHIDHTGLLPKLVKEGFKGKVFSTPPTRDFANLLLLDSEHILFQEAEHHKKPPLYGVREIEELMARWEGVPYHQEIKVGPIKAAFYNAGHILGSSIVKAEVERKIIVFSGDLGNSPSPIIGSTEKFEEVDYCLVESTHGKSLHKEEPKGYVEDIIEDTIKAGGVLMIPAFAMERTQKLLYEINELVENGRVPQVPIFLDSPLAIKMTEVYKKYKDYFDAETVKLLMSGDALFEFPGLKKTLTVEESKSINEVNPPKIIIAGSGMSHGGRILHHEKRYLSDPKSTILFIGYQTKNSLGRKILEGEKMVKIHGEEVPVLCRVVSIENYSAHADQRQLLEWLHPMRLALKKVFVVQGEEEASVALAQKIINDLAVYAEIPEPGKAYNL
jgi:metallo-beta-lactamase family protein